MNPINHLLKFRPAVPSLQRLGDDFLGQSASRAAIGVALALAVFAILLLVSGHDPADALLEGMEWRHRKLLRPQRGRGDDDTAGIDRIGNRHSHPRRFG